MMPQYIMDTDAMYKRIIRQSAEYAARSHVRPPHATLQDAVIAYMVGHHKACATALVKEAVALAEKLTDTYERERALYMRMHNNVIDRLCNGVTLTPEEWDSCVLELQSAGNNTYEVMLDTEECEQVLHDAMAQMDALRPSICLALENANMPHIGRYIIARCYCAYMYKDDKDMPY